MQIQTHVLSGWCVADFFQLTPRERALAMVAASAADLDGLGLLVSIEYYSDYHHVIGHNLFFGLLLSGILTLFATHRRKAFLLFLALFHLHLLLDYYGSGPGWGIAYLWPFSTAEVQSPYAWALNSWQNFVAFGLCLGGVVAILYRRRRTPLEALMPSLDAQIVERFVQRFVRTPNKPVHPAPPPAQFGNRNQD